MKETRPLWPPQRGVGLREPNLGKTNPRVSLDYSLAICFASSLADSIIFLTLTRLVVVIIFKNFSFALFTPPSRRLSTAFGSGLLVALPLAECVVFAGFLVGGVDKGLALFLGQQRCLRCFVNRWGCLGEQVPTFGAHRSCYEKTPRDGTQES